MIKIRADDGKGFTVSVDIDEKDLGIANKELTEDERFNLCMVLTSLIVEANGRIESEELGEKFKELIEIYGSIARANTAIQLSSKFTVEPMRHHTLH